MARVTSILIGTLSVVCMATTGLAANKLKKLPCTTDQIPRFDGDTWVCSDAVTRNESAIDNETVVRQAADADLQNQIDQLAGTTMPVDTAKTYAGSAFAASIEQGGEGWAPNFEGYGFMTPAEERTGTNRIALVTLNTDVQLPDGAVVTEFSCYWYDNDPDGDIYFIDANLFRRELLGVGTGGRGLTSLARITTPTGSMNGVQLDEIQHEVDDLIVEPVIDNVSFSYFINVVYTQEEPPPANPSWIRWYGCQVRYQMP